MTRKQRIFPLLIFWSLFVSGTLVGQAPAQSDTLRILFVGNSFTYYYNLSQVVASMAESQDFPMMTRQSTVGGSTLEQHWKQEKGTRTRALLDSLPWDYVVFNNHSLATIEDGESFHLYCEKFANLVREKGAEPIFMETWGYKANPLMFNIIQPAYEKMSSTLDADLVPCGQLFAAARSLRPEMNLFFDEKHPSYQATYMMGLAFYKYFSGNSTENMPRRLTTIDKNGEKLYLIFMHQEDADFLQQLVDEFDFQTRE